MKGLQQKGTTTDPLGRGDISIDGTTYAHILDFLRDRAVEDRETVALLSDIAASSHRFDVEDLLAAEVVGADYDAEIDAYDDVRLVVDTEDGARALAVASQDVYRIEDATLGTVEFWIVPGGWTMPRNTHGIVGTISER